MHYMLSKQVAVYPVCGSYAAPDICAGSVAGSCERVGGGEKVADNLLEVMSGGNGKGSARSDQVGGFLEFAVVRTEHYRYAVNRGLIYIVDSCAEPPSDISDVGKSVQG